MNKFQGLLEGYPEMGKGPDAPTASREILQREKQAEAVFLVSDGNAKPGGRQGSGRRILHGILNR